jgi:hypothetical protein
VPGRAAGITGRAGPGRPDCTGPGWARPGLNTTGPGRAGPTIELTKRGQAGPGLVTDGRAGPGRA